MKSVFKISIVANVFLAGVVFWLTQRAPANAKDPVELTAPGTNTEAVQQPAVSPASEATQPEPQAKFQWSQLESPDYLTYIANLKAIQCPDRTIRDIVTADVDNRYEVRRWLLARKKLVNGTALSRFNSQQAIDAKIQVLNEEEASLLATLLGPLGGGSQNTENEPQPQQNQSDQAENTNVSVPLALQSIDPDVLKLTDEQVADINYLRQNFQQEVAGPGQDPTDPEYLKRWQAAQPDNDQMLHAMLGTQAYEQLQRQNDTFAAGDK